MWNENRLCRRSAADLALVFGQKRAIPKNGHAVHDGLSHFSGQVLMQIRTNFMTMEQRIRCKLEISFRLPNHQISIVSGFDVAFSVV